MIGEVHYATVFVYMHGGKDKYRRMQVKRLHRALSRIPNGTRVALGGDWNFVLSVDRDIANPSHEYGKNDNIGQTECRDMMAGPAIKLTEVYEQLDIPVNHPGDLTWARGGKFSIGVVKRLDFWLMNADMIAAIDGEPRVKKESRCPELKAAQKQLQELRELEPDADCWDTVSQEWDRATRQLRNSLEDSARGASRWDDATRLNNGDNEVIGRLLSQRQDSANFTSMLVYDAQKDDVMSAELISKVNPTYSPVGT